MKKGLIENSCGIYAPAVVATLEFLQSEMDKQEKVRKTAKSYKKSSIKKIKYSDIDEIMSFAFGPAPRHMGDIRRCYFSPSENEAIHSLRDSSWEFNARRLVDKCEEHQIDISKEIKEIQQLYISTLTVAEVLDTGNSSITDDIKAEIRTKIRSLCATLKMEYGFQYWETVFKYLPKCVAYPQLKDLMVLLPKCSDSFVENWARQFKYNVHTVPQEYREVLEKEYSFLKDYSETLSALSTGQPSTAWIWEEVFYSLTVEDLRCALLNKHLVSSLSTNQLGAVDLQVAYSVLTQLTDDVKENVFYPELAEEINFDGVIAF